MPNPNDKVTTVGSLILKHSMPTKESKEAFDIYRPLDKTGMASMVNMLLKHGGPDAHEHINNLGKVFFNKATEIGASTPLTDYINESDERAAIIKEYEFKVHQILDNKSLTKDQKNNQLGELTGSYNKKIEKQNLDYLVNRGSTAAKMARTGARGNPAQLATGTSTPLMSLNVKGELVPIVIKHSFAQGMTPAEHLAMSYMGRGSTVLSQLSTALPGALFKRLAPTVFHETITDDDCKTTNGILKPVSDTKAIIGRFEASTGRLIDDAYYKELKEHGKEVKIRSSLTCEAHEGVCKKCYGLMASGKMPEIGENVGVIAAQSVSEVLTQAMLSTKHKATVGERKGNIYEQASNLLNNPKENFKDEATISETNGKVNAITMTPLKDYHVFVNGVRHFVPRVQQLKVQEGDTIRQGQALSTGVVNPRKLVSMRGLGEGRIHMANELRDIYGGGLDPRHFELISKNLVKYVEVKDPGDSDFLPGDKIPVNTIQKHLQGKESTTPLTQAEGKMLSRGIFEFTPGTVLDKNHIQDLAHRNVQNVYTTSSTLKVAPIIPGLQTAKLLDKNWISNLSFAKLETTIKDAAAVGAESAAHSTDPIAPYIIGREFGEGEHGKY